MSRIDQVFNRLKKEQKTAFIGFITAGDPDILTCLACVRQLEDNGCDIIEIGIPFSDPIAEGPIIQEANLRALAHGITTNDIFHMVKTIRQSSQIPLVFTLYYNQIYKYGTNVFIQFCAEAGIDALIIPDLPYEHQDEIRSIAKLAKIQLISLIAPVSSKRIQMITNVSEGFLYCVPSFTDMEAFMKELQMYTKTPKALNNAITTPEQITALKPFVDGIIVDHAIVHEIGKLANHEAKINDVGALVKKLADAAHNV